MSKKTQREKWYKEHPNKTRKEFAKQKTARRLAKSRATK